MICRKRRDNYNRQKVEERAQSQASPTGSPRFDSIADVETASAASAGTTRSTGPIVVQ